VGVISTYVKSILSQSIIEVIFIMSFIGGTFLLFDDFSIQHTFVSVKLIVLSYTYT